MTRDKVLAILLNSEGYISGEAVSDRLGVSRAAVNGAVKSLRGEGYVIESCTNKGYRLISRPDLLSPGEIEARIGEERMRTVHVYDTLDSTNIKAKELGYAGCPSGTVVIADMQTGGRGRLGRSFLSPGNCGIYMSVLLRPSTQPSETGTITAWTAVATADAIAESTGITPGIKWVNDLVINGRKICGILTELSVESESGRIDSIVIGIGINVLQEADGFPEELRDKAASIASEHPQIRQDLSRSDIAASLIRAIDKLERDWPSSKDYYLRRYRELNVTVGKDVTVFPVAPASEDQENGSQGHVLGINDDFSLKVRMADGSVRDLSSGEVRVRGLYGYT